MSYYSWILLILGGSCLREGTGQNLNLSTASVMLNESEAFNISCFASVNDEEETILWYRMQDESIDLVTNETSTGEDFQTFYLNGSFAEAVLTVFGEIENNAFAKFFLCKANFTNKTQEKNLTVDIQVPLQYVDKPVPEYVCLNETRSITCTFRGYPLPEVTWEDQSEVTTSIKNEFVSSTLYISNLNEREDYTCVANQKSIQREIFVVFVRDDVLDNVSHANAKENHCRVTWDSTFVPPYTTGFQIKFRLNNQDVMIAISNASATEYYFQIRGDYVINNVSIAIEMNECRGPFIFSTGTCVFQDFGQADDPYLLALIIVSTLAGVIILILVAILGIQYYRRKHVPPEEEKSIGKQFSTRVSNKYVPQPSGSSGTGSQAETVDEAVYAETVEPSGDITTLQRRQHQQQEHPPLHDRSSHLGAADDGEPLYGNAEVIESTLPRTRKNTQAGSFVHASSGLHPSQAGYDNEAVYDESIDINTDFQPQPTSAPHHPRVSPDVLYEEPPEETYITMTHSQDPELDPPESLYEVSFTPAPIQKDF